MTIEELHDLFLQHPGISTDSRVCPKDSIFFALKGERFNGNLFATAAL
ncbi:MAG TPA: UDP-N-acetylmuramoyl-tripeptide--D-alanyl-D-alanine ligase, partial [Porphyromonadaceae bacterium]|nr:UDP-N-acetylmuramoyl-tripeptide--D-alanyl-D-alanine ligase [Porphyromonadaceae bacterium]